MEVIRGITHTKTEQDGQELIMLVLVNATTHTGDHYDNA
jgi:hypothetical protein